MTLLTTLIKMFSSNFKRNLYRLPIVRIWAFISLRSRQSLLKVLIYMLFSALLEFVSISLIIPFLLALTNPQLLKANAYSSYFVGLLGEVSLSQLRLILSLLFIIIILFSSISRIIALWRIGVVSARVGTDLSRSAFSKILCQPYEFYQTTNTSSNINLLTKQIESTITSIRTSLRFSISFITSIFIFAAFFVMSPSAAVLVLVFLSTSYYIISRLSNLRLKENSKKIVNLSTQQVKLMQESFGAIRDIKLDGSYDFFFDRYKHIDQSNSLAFRAKHIFGLFPKIFNGGNCFNFHFIHCVYILILNPLNSKYVLPSLGVVAFGLQRLLPQLQQMYTSWSQILSFTSDIEGVTSILNLSSIVSEYSPSQFDFSSVMKVTDLGYKYSNDSEYIFSSINVEFRAGSFVGIIGESGGGKSTFFDILMGFYSPTCGSVKVDNKNIFEDNNMLRSWQSSIAHVPQDIYLIDGTIAQNIALGIENDRIDLDKLEKVARIANILGFVNSLPNRFNTSVGERGFFLSGGQKQRIGLARALYKSPQVLFLDEATSALDNQSETEIMENLAKIKNTMTIFLITHKPLLLSACDEIYEMKNQSLCKISCIH